MIGRLQVISPSSPSSIRAPRPPAGDGKNWGSTALQMPCSFQLRKSVIHLALPASTPWTSGRFGPRCVPKTISLDPLPSCPWDLKPRSSSVAAPLQGASEASPRPPQQVPPLLLCAWLRAAPRPLSHGPPVTALLPDVSALPELLEVSSQFSSRASLGLHLVGCTTTEQRLSHYLQGRVAAPTLRSHTEEFLAALSRHPREAGLPSGPHREAAVPDANPGSPAPKFSSCLCDSAQSQMHIRSRSHEM